MIRSATRELLEAMSFDWEKTILLYLAFPLDDEDPLAPVVKIIARRLRLGQEPVLENVAFLRGPDLVRRPDRVFGPTLPPVVRQAYRNAIDRLRRRIGKWGDTVWEEDPNPQIRSLGFVTLVRRLPQETAVFQLFPPEDPGILRAAPSPTTPDGPPLAASPTLQYRPFENRGLEGSLLLRLEPGSPGAARLADQLSDLILEVTVRCCHDAALAAAVRADRNRTNVGLSLAALAAGSLATPPIAPPALEPGVAAGELRTVHLSLRAHRDRTLQIWQAAVLLNPAAVPRISPLTADLSFLRRDDPFTPLVAADGSFLPIELQLSSAPDLPEAPAIATEDDLLTLAGTLKISPSDLGIPVSLLDPGAATPDDAELVGIGLAVIPTADGTVQLPEDPHDPLVDPLSLELDVGSPLDRMLPPDFVGSLPTFERRLVMTTDAPAQPLTLRELFESSPAIQLRIPTDCAGTNAFGSPKLLYDVIFSLSYRVPVLSTVTRAVAVA